MTRLGGASLCGASALLAALAGSLAPAAASAQSKMSLHPAVDVSQIWTDNVFYNAKDVRSDSVTRIYPRLTLSEDDSGGSTRIRVGGTSNRYQRYDELNSFDPFASFEAQRAVTDRLKLFASGEVEERKHTDAVQKSDLTLYGGRSSVRYYKFNAGSSYALSPSMSLDTQLGYAKVEFDDNEGLSDPAGYTITSLQAGLQRALSARESVGFAASLQRNSLDAVDGTERSQRDDDIARLAARWNRTWTPRLSTMLEVGARYLTTDGGELQTGGIDTTPDDSFAFIGSARVDYRTLKGAVHLNLSKETRPDNGSQGSRDVTSASLVVARRLLKKLTFRAGGSYSLSRTSGEAISALDERFWSAWSELSWRFSRRWSTFVRYDHQRYSNDLPLDQDWTANRFRVGVRWAYDLPL